MIDNILLDISISNRIVIDIKNNRYNNIILISMYSFEKEELHYLENPTKEQCNLIVDKIIENENLKVYTYDVKYLFNGLIKTCEVSEKLTELIKRFEDISLYLYDIYGKNTDLFYSKVLNSINTKSFKKNKIFDFYNYSSGLDITPYELIDIDIVKKLSSNQIEVIRNIVQTLSLNSKRYIDLYTLASYYYSLLESVGIKIDQNAMKQYSTDDISRYFIGLSEGDEKVYIQYNFTHSTTGRLSSKFHNFPKSTFGDILTPSETNGKFFALDFSCFEFKTLLYYLGIEFKQSDPYKFIADKVGLKRNVVKNNMIKFMYGSSEVDFRISHEINSVFDLDKRLNSVVNKAKEDKKIETPYGKTVTYRTSSEVATKAVNNIIQNVSTYISIYTFCFLQAMLKNNKSKIVATIYDEIIIDVASEEEEDVLHKLELLKTIPILQNKYVNFDFTVLKGCNFSEIDK